VLAGAVQEPSGQVEPGHEADAGPGPFPPWTPVTGLRSVSLDTSASRPWLKEDGVRIEQNAARRRKRGYAQEVFLDNQRPL